MDIPKDKSFPRDAGQCHGCGGNGCKECEDKGWLPAGHAGIRVCELEVCSNPLPPGHVAVYCSNECAHADAAGVGSNAKRSPISVRHSNLKRVSDESDYKSHCPECKKGVLVVRRHPKTFRIQEVDFCFLCGQQFIYEDIDVLRSREE